MKWEELLTLAQDEPVITAGFLSCGSRRLGDVRLQLSRWRKAGKLLQLRRGIYVLAPPYRKINPEPFLLANTLKAASYVSLQSALAYNGLIPEYVPVVTSVTTGRPEERDTPLGRFLYRRVKQSWFFGYRQVPLSGRQSAFIAAPEKALLDLAYLTPDATTAAYWQQLRLQNLERLDLKQIDTWVQEHGGKKLKTAARHIRRRVESETGEEL